jgi:hypothetical protein
VYLTAESPSASIAIWLRVSSAGGAAALDEGSAIVRWSLTAHNAEAYGSNGGRDQMLAVVDAQGWRLE